MIPGSCLRNWAYSEQKPKSSTVGNWTAIYKDLLTFDDPKTRLSIIDCSMDFNRLVSVYTSGLSCRYHYRNGLVRMALRWEFLYPVQPALNHLGVIHLSNILLFFNIND